MLLIIRQQSSSNTFEIGAEEDIGFLKQLIQMDCGIAMEQQQLEFNGKVLSSGTLTHNQLHDGCEIVLSISAKRERAYCIADIPVSANAEEIMRLVHLHPHLQNQFNNADPELAAVIATNDIGKLRVIMMKRHMNNHKRVYDREQEMIRLDNDPSSEESQRRIAEIIRQKAVDDNMEAAMESLPEGFGRVVMLYIDTKVNGVEVKCFVDSGAQMTVMTKSCVERCGLSRILDTRYVGEARGVGSAKIVGRIHLAQMELGNKEYYPVSITVLEGGDVDFLLGLDMLKRHRALIDLNQGCMTFTGSTAIPFLSEKDMPLAARGHYVEPEPSHSSSSSSSSSASASSTTASSSQEPEAMSVSEGGPNASTAPNATERNDHLIYLTSCGFTPADCVSALDNSGNDVELALQLLLSMHS